MSTRRIEPPGRPGVAFGTVAGAPALTTRQAEGRISEPQAVVRSALWPGLGQWGLGRRWEAIVYAVPPLLLVLVAVAALVGLGVERVAAYLIQPQIALAALIVIVALGVWRLASMAGAAAIAGRGQRAGMTVAGRLATVVAVVAVVAVHAYGAWFALGFLRFGESVFGGDGPSVPAIAEPLATPPGATAAPLPLPTERVTVLFVGIDATPLRVGDPPLSDTIMLVTFHPGAGTVDMVSVPRDTALFPLYDRPDLLFDDKINMLMHWADQRPGRYPEGGLATLVHQVEFLLGLDIDFYAAVEIAGFARLVDAVGGVDVVNERLINDPTFQFSLDEIGFRMEPGPQHLDGRLALAYVRSRHGAGNNDFLRAERQQQVILAMRERLDDPQVLVRLPDLLAVAGEAVRTDLPPDQVPIMTELADQSRAARVRSVVLGPTRYASLIPPDQIRGLSAYRLDLDAVAEISARLWGSDSSYSRPRDR